MRPIDADALEKVLQKRSVELMDEHLPKMSGTLMGAMCYVAKAPTLDLVQPVKCGECGYLVGNLKINIPNHCCRGIFKDNFHPSKDLNYAYGERKDDVK